MADEILTILDETDKDSLEAQIKAVSDSKQNTITGAATTITDSNLTASRALVSNSSGKVGVSFVTSTELGYLDGVTSNVQTQLNNKSDTSHTHLYAGSATAGGPADSLGITDTRKVEETPAELLEANGKGIHFNFKETATIGISDSTYAATMSVLPWTNWSGGKATQLAFGQSGNIYTRKGIDESWDDSWRTIVDSGNLSSQAVATSSKSGIMSYNDKKILDRLTYRNLGEMKDKTVADLQSALRTWLNEVCYTPNSVALFKVGDSFISLWNAGDTTTALVDGQVWTVTLKTYYSSGAYAMLELCSYYDKKVYYTAISNGQWKGLRKVALDVAATTSEAGLMSATDKGKLDGIEAGATNYEAYLKWGGKSISGNISPIDAACSNVHSANRFQFSKPAGITVEYSTDGKTWIDYEATDTKKINLVSDIGTTFLIGKRSTGTTVNDKLRVTLDATAMGMYVRLRKLLINVSTNHATGCNVIVEKSMKGSATTFTIVDTYPISGWSGWNSIPLSSPFGGTDTQTSNIAALRLTFGITAINTSKTSNALTIMNILGLGDVFWSYPSNMAKTGHLYSYDDAQNATFPAKVTATTFSGSLSGNATSATKATQDGSGNVITSTYATKSNLANIFGEYYDLATTVTPGANYSTASGEATLVGNMLRVKFSAERTSAANGNIDNETVATFSITHGGKITGGFAVSIGNGTSGHLANMVVSSVSCNATTLTFTVTLTATGGDTSKLNPFFAMPVLIDISKF